MCKDEGEQHPELFLPLCKGLCCTGQPELWYLLAGQPLREEKVGGYPRGYSCSSSWLTLHSEKKDQEGERRKNLRIKRGRSCSCCLDNPLPIGPSQEPLRFGTRRRLFLKRDLGAGSRGAQNTASWAEYERSGVLQSDVSSRQTHRNHGSVRPSEKNYGVCWWVPRAVPRSACRSLQPLRVSRGSLTSQAGCPQACSRHLAPALDINGSRKSSFWGCGKRGLRGGKGKTLPSGHPG